MRPPSWMTPGEHRLALALLAVALLGLAAQALEGLDPEVRSWLREPLPPPLRPQAAPPRRPPAPTIVDPNTASPESLDALPGIGPALAKRIVQNRPYQAADDLLRVPGIGPATLRKMEPWLAFGDSAGVGQSPQYP